MSNLNPDQFGFVPRPEEEWYDARANTDYQGERDVDPNMLLHTGQDAIYPDVVKHYVEHPDSEHVNRDRMDKDYPHEPPQVYRFVGDDNVPRDYVGEGHHRIAAARVRGDKSIRVAWHEWGY